VLNADDPRVAAMRYLYAGKVITYGCSEVADARADDIKLIQRLAGSKSFSETELGTSFTLHYDNVSQNIEVMEILGTPSVYSLLAAVVVGKYFGLTLQEISLALKQVLPTPGRLRPLAGIRNTMLIDDSYNASPEAVIEALKVLKQIRCRRRIAVLGDMLELGVTTETAHRRVGRIVKDMGVDLLFTVGSSARYIADEARAVGFPKTKIFKFKTAEEAGLVLAKKLKEGDVTLIKGSQNTRMERVTLQVMSNSQNAKQLLCRQSKRWQQV
jgi:UDP-N-acetylmuramoyl-tripeptide--D-alanyl-D-alanine ligase